MNSTLAIPDTRIVPTSVLSSRVSVRARPSRYRADGNTPGEYLAGAAILGWGTLLTLVLTSMA